MNILHVYKDYFPVLGGIENHIKALAEAQVAAGHRVTVLVCNRGRRTVEEILNGVRIVKAGRVANVVSTPLSPAFPRMLRRLRPDITHLHIPYPLGEISQWIAARGELYVVTYHADVTRATQRAVMLLYGPVLRHILRGAARVLATSPNYAASSPVLRRVAERIRVVPLGVDANRFTPPRAAPGGRPDGAPRPATILFVGRMRHYKGVDDLLRALRQLPDTARLVLAGDGPKRRDWEALSHALGLRERVTFLGDVPDDSLPELYQSAAVFALPATTRAEAFGTVLLEAMATALPCVTTEVGAGTSYVVEHGVTGVVVPPRSPAALAQAIHSLLSDPARRAQMGAAGRDRVCRNFTLEAMCRRVEEVYHQALAARWGA